MSIFSDTSIKYYEILDTIRQQDKKKYRDEQLWKSKALPSQMADYLYRTNQRINKSKKPSFLEQESKCIRTLQDMTDKLVLEEDVVSRRPWA